MLKNFSGALLALLAGACATDRAPDHNAPKHLAAARSEFVAVTPLSFDSGGAISRQFHLNAESYLTMATIARTGPAHALTKVPNRQLAEQAIAHANGRDRFADYVSSDPLLDGVIVVQGNRVVFEAYPNMHPWQRHFAWSVTKMVTATAVAVLQQRQLVDMGAPLGRYVPALADSAWDKITVQAIADMASGIDCLDSDGYQDNTTCIYATEESLGIAAATGRNPDFIEQLRSMQSHKSPGTTTEYVSANTHVLMLLIEAVTGKPYAAAVQELIWEAIAPEADALMAVSKQGYAYGAGGLHARLRDVARFGQIYTRPALRKVLTRASIKRMAGAGLALDPAGLEGLRSSMKDDLPTRSAWQWDLIWADGAMYKSGYLGQGLYVDPDKELVIAWFGTGLDYNSTVNSMLAVSRQLAAGDWLKSASLASQGLEKQIVQPKVNSQ
ncbi:MAG: serine hydrolase domain-containing protein [Pseudomonadales bacterium]